METLVRETVRVPVVTLDRVTRCGVKPRNALSQMLDRVDRGVPLDEHTVTAPSGVSRTVRLGAGLVSRCDELAVSPAVALHAWCDLVDRGDVTPVVTPALITPDRHVTPSPLHAGSPAVTPRRVTQAARVQASQRAVWIATVAAVLVGVASAVLSFRATAAFAVTSGVTSAGWAWLFPVTLEGSVLSASVSTWSRAGNRMLSWFVLVTASALAICANVLHVPTVIDGAANVLLWQGRVAAAVPPLAYLAAVETVAALRARSTR